MNQIQLIADGLAWNGSYTIKAGKVCVASAYGGARATLKGEADADAIAHDLLEKLVKRWSPALQGAEFERGRPYSASARR